MGVIEDKAALGAVVTECGVGYVGYYSDIVPWVSVRGKGRVLRSAS